jgi:cyclase
MKSKYPHYYRADLSIFNKAKLLRKDSTPAEKHFWEIIRNRNVLDFKFRRQHPLLYYVADFYCHEALLVIELDGDIHNLEEIKKRDKEREKTITELGITVLRFSNDQIFLEIEKVLEKVETHLQKFK